MKKRIISTLLATSMLLSLAACGGKDTTDTKGPADTTEGTKITENAGIAEQNYGKDINIAILEWGLYKKYFAPNDDMTDVMNKALYNRELAVEEYLGVNITYDYIGDWMALYPALQTAVSTNDDLYQIALNHCTRDNSKLITDGLIVDMNELDINFDGEWFNQKANDALSVAGKQFFCVSDYMLPDPNAIFFNKDLIEKNNLEDPYQLVRDGKWTIDKMTEMANAVTADNGDTVWDVNDTYGFSCPDNWYNVSFIYGAGVDIISKNEDDEFELVYGGERTYTMMEKLDALINSSNTWQFNHMALDKNPAYVNDAITIESGRCLFTMWTLNMLHTIRDVDINFGILPYPKLDEAQEEYISNDWTGLICVPMSLPEDSYTMVGDVIELLSYNSAEEVIPAYIDVTLGTKLSRDEESREMLEIIFDGCTFDPGLNFFGNVAGPNIIIYSVDQMLIGTGENNLASFLATNVPAAETVIAEFNEAIKNLE